MEAFFVHRYTSVAVLVYPIYINCVSWNTDNILGFGGVGTLPQMLNRGIGSHPKKHKQKIRSQPITAFTLSSVCIENLVRPDNQCDSFVGVTPIFFAKSFFRTLFSAQYLLTASCIDVCILLPPLIIAFARFNEYYIHIHLQFLTSPRKNLQLIHKCCILKKAPKVF